VSALAADFDAGALKIIDLVVAAPLDMWVPPRPFDDCAELAERVDRTVQDASVAACPPEFVMPAPHPLHPSRIEQAFE
jgi:hypothetical protein